MALHIRLFDWAAYDVSTAAPQTANLIETFPGPCAPFHVLVLGPLLYRARRPGPAIGASLRPRAATTTATIT
ncbi:hypothetical protein GCM10009692_28390 [Leucobacter aridicollis]